MWPAWALSAASNWSSTLPYRTYSTQWDDVRAPVSALSPGATPADPIVFGSAGAVRVRGFAVGEDMDGAIQLPHAYKEGADIHPHAHWAPVDASAGNVQWSLQYYWLNVGEAAVGAPTTILIEQAASGTAWLQQKAHYAPISGTGKLISSMLVFRIQRVAASASEYGADAAFLELDCHFESDSLGSREEMIK
jgi:hypothetical protein